MTENGGPGGPIEHGFPHLATVRASITALFRRLSADGIRAHATSITPADAAFDAADDLHLGAQRVAAATLRALRLPDARMVVSFRAMEEAATVELAAGPEYFVEVNDRFRTHRRDLAAALSHEVAHVLLHRLDLRFPGAAENELLTDTLPHTWGPAGCSWTPTARTRSPTSGSATSRRRSSATSWPSAPPCSARTPPPGSPAPGRTRPTYAGGRSPSAITAGPRWRPPDRWPGAGTRRRGAPRPQGPAPPPEPPPGPPRVTDRRRTASNRTAPGAGCG